MSRINWTKNIFTIPNWLSLIRLGLIPIYTSIYLNAQDMGAYLLSGWILAFSCATDAVDGFIARRFHMESDLGRVLDPLADKLTQLSLTLCLSLRYKALQPVAAMLVIKEICQLIGAAALVARGRPLPGPIMAGKISTTILFVSLTVLVVFPAIPLWVVSAVAVLDCLALIYAFLHYCFAFFDNVKPKRQPGT